MKYYAGIGSRQTPSHVLKEMEDLAWLLADKGWTVRTGGADGADTACEKGGMMEGDGAAHIYLPWDGFNGRSIHEHGNHERTSDLFITDTLTDEAHEIAKQYHPVWNRLSLKVKKLMARNSYQVLGCHVYKDPSRFVMCWTSDGQASGGTGQAIRIAKAHDIPVYNLYFTGMADHIRTTIIKGGKQ